MDEALLKQIGLLEPIYADGILPGGLINLGPTFGTVYFRYVPLPKDANAVPRFQKVPCLYLIRPQLTACQMTDCPYMTTVKAASAPIPHICHASDVVN